MTEYYKALRPDGTDFATGRTKPRKGSWMPRIEGDLVMCKRGYHISDAAAETLVGGSWPCKLARVEIPEGQWRRDDHKLLVPTYRVVEWLPAWQALGPNGEEVAAMIRRMTPGQEWSLIAAWDAARDAAWAAAWAAAWDAARDAARAAAWAAAWDAARDAAWAASLALVVRDLITPEQFDILYGPWRSATDDAE